MPQLLAKPSLEPEACSNRTWAKAARQVEHPFQSPFRYVLKHSWTIIIGQNLDLWGHWDKEATLRTANQGPPEG